MLPSRCGCAPGRRPTRRSISPSGSTGGATRWRNELVPTAEIVVAEAAGDVIGFVTVDPRTALSRPDRGRAGALGFRRRRGAHRHGQTNLAGGPRSRRQHRQCPRHPLLRQGRDFSSPAPASMPFPASRFTACAGGRTGVKLSCPEIAASPAAHKGRRRRQASGACPPRRCGPCSSTRMRSQDKHGRQPMGDDDRGALLHQFGERGGDLRFAFGSRATMSPRRATIAAHRARSRARWRCAAAGRPRA